MVMKDFKFLSSVDDEDAVEPNLDRFHELIGYQRRTEIDILPTETPQIYTQIIRVELPINQMSEDHLNHLKISNQSILLNQISDTLDFRHEIIHQDENGFTLRTELYL
jgi:hypothetical protein